ncbi:protein kinase domain-containing protein [Rhodococcus jostii]|uniref:Non-specific serine/threonine protein kinase n=1 Tax=Rhodococcus jostii TaxID=132919 RepID=A0A1H4IKF9_RHOJO|nr:protein kinase [Rhodococcus jostii]SEB34500.1 non-specific serine/threonine protein kinase [Rhodococcus jostii]
MAELNSIGSRRDITLAAASELAAAGFEDPIEIGHGGFGVVYRCRQPSLRRTVAVKVLTSLLDPENLERFLREQQAMGRLSEHPNIVTILQAGATSSGLPYIVMPYHPQDSLDVRIRQDGPLGWDDTLHLGVKVAGALETAHRRDVLHRDVKPANILLTEYDEPQLTDFGIAHMAGAFETTAGTITGSPAFTAPEVLAGQSPSPASDIYGLGATLFCALTGHAPFERRSGERVVAQFLRITTEPLPDLREQDVPDDVSAAIESAMARDPNDRPPTAAAFGDQLRAAERHHDCRVDDMAVPASNNTARTDQPTMASPAGRPTEHSQVPRTSTLNASTTPPARDGPFVSGKRRRSGNLPLELTSFVGRRHERAEAKKMLSAYRLVTLTGIGGVGKTRLALRVATDSRRAFPEGVWLVELGEVRDTMLVTSAVFAALGLREQSADPPLTLLADYLADRRLLLVLDNCEHLVKEVASMVESLLRSCPGLRVLATSREPLGIGGEVSMRVPPLAVPDVDRSTSVGGLPRYEAVALFTERAATAVPGFDLTEDNQRVVAEICQRLDGLPLPIELAAVRLRAMSAQQILDRLTDRYRLLSVGNRGAPSRQQTLRLCIDWSYELCTPREQQLWAQCSVFAGSFELDAAEAICANDLPSADMLDVVASLVDKSILIREEPGAVVRYRLLETLRDYGREKLQTSGEYEVFRRRHRDWYEQLVQQAEAEWISPHQLEWIARLEREQPNLRDTLRFCLDDPREADVGLRIAGALFPFWLSRGLHSEGRLWLDRLLAVDDGQSSAYRVKALYADSVLAGTQGDVVAGRALLAEGDDVADQPGTSSQSALSGYAAGCMALFSGDPSRAVADYKRALTAPQEDGNPLRRIASLFGLGLAYGLLGDTVGAISCHEEILAVTERRGETVYRGRSSLAAGLALWAKGEADRATALLEQGVRLTRPVDDPAGAARCLQTLAWIEADQHHEARAAVLLGAAEGWWRSMGGPTVSFPDMLVYQEECERRTRRALGEREFKKNFHHGNALIYEDAVAYALGKKPRVAQAQSSDAVNLTRRERQVADLVAEGLTNKAIAERLVISDRTAQGHVEHILSKLGFTSRTQVAAWVVEQTQNPTT